MTCFQIVEAQPWHCGQMARLLRIEHHRAVFAAGVGVHQELRRAFDESPFRKAWLIDGRLAGLGGVRSPLFAPLGFVWLALSNEALCYPIEVVKEGRRQLEEIMKVKRQLATLLLEGDEPARRFAIFMGFHAEPQGLGARAHSRHGRQGLLRYITNSADNVVSVGRSRAVVVCYSEEAA